MRCYFLSMRFVLSSQYYLNSLVTSKVDEGMMSEFPTYEATDGT